MLSLNKTKSVDELKEWLGNQTGLLSWKMDGLTVVLTYENGVLSKAVTRGNGEIGEVITGNARTFVNLPMSIPYKERLILRGKLSSPIRILKNSMPPSQTQTPGIKIPGICAAALSAS